MFKWKPKRREEDKAETTGEERRAQDFPKLMKDPNSQLPHRINKNIIHIQT